MIAGTVFVFAVFILMHVWGLCSLKSNRRFDQERRDRNA